MGFNNETLFITRQTEGRMGWYLFCVPHYYIRLWWTKIHIFPYINCLLCSINDTFSKHQQQTKPKTNMYMNPGRFHRITCHSTGWGLSHTGSKPQVAPVTRRKVAASLTAQCWKLWRIMSEPSSRHWCDRDVNETVGGLQCNTDMARRRFGGGTLRTPLV